MRGHGTPFLVFFSKEEPYFSDGAERSSTLLWLRWYGLNGSFAGSEWDLD